MDVAVGHSARPAAGGIGGGVSGSGRPLDEARQHYMDVQQHAAAVQLLNRGLAVAHLRAELAMPRGGAVALPPRQQAVKHEPGAPNGTQDDQRQQQLLPWQAPQQPAQTAAAASDQQAIAIQVSSSAAALQLQQADQPQQQQPLQPEPAAARRARLPRRQLVHRAPDPLAAALFAAGDDEAAGVDAAAAGSGAGPLLHPLQPGAQHTAHASLPRMVADPALAAQQLAGWVRLGPDGAPLPQLEVAAGGVGGAAAAPAGDGGSVAQGMAGGGAPGDGGVPGGSQQQQPAAEEDLMDEEEWV